MWRRHVLLALGLVWGASCLAPAFAVNPPSTSPPREVAKLPTSPPPAVAKEVQPPAATTAAGVKVAQLTYPVATTASAQGLLLAAADYAYYGDVTHQRQYLQQVLASAPGTQDAGRALALLADGYRREDAGEAEALDAQLVASYPDAEVQAFASLLTVASPAWEAKRWEALVALYASAAEEWKGTPFGGWAALRLGDVYRFGTDDLDKAIAVFRGVMGDYPGTPLAEEALVCEAESLNWSGRMAEALPRYQAAVAGVHSPGLYVRARIGLGDSYMTQEQLGLAHLELSHLIAGFATHPGVVQAYAFRASVKEKLGDWEGALADAKAYLTRPNTGIFHRCYSQSLLAQGAFRGGRYADAMVLYAELAAAAAGSRHSVEFVAEAEAGIGACRQQQGDLRGALRDYLQAASDDCYPHRRAAHLAQAATLAAQLGDAAAMAAVSARMVAEVPDSHLTARVVGHEVLPAPEI